MEKRPAEIPSMALAPETILRASHEYGLALRPRQILQVQSYVRLLLLWNPKVGLTAIQDPLEILYRHFCESMYAAAAVPIRRGRLADVGSGGGFPGLPLKIICPELDVFLVESNVKRATFLAEVIRELELPGIRVLVSRYEELGEELAPLDFVCARAVGEFSRLLSWAGSQIIAANHVVLWVGGKDSDVIRKTMEWRWQEPIPIPHSLRRYLLVGERGS